MYLLGNEQLARSGTNCLENLVLASGMQFLPDVWDKVCSCARDIFMASIPSQLTTWKPDENLLARYIHQKSFFSYAKALITHPYIVNTNKYTEGRGKHSWWVFLFTRNSKQKYNYG